MRGEARRARPLAAIAGSVAFHVLLLTFVPCLLLVSRKASEEPLTMIVRHRRSPPRVCAVATPVERAVVRKVTGAEHRPLREDPIMTGLEWLARHQGADGSWSAAGFGAQCKGEACRGAGDANLDVAVTGLAVLAFLGAGYVPSARDVYVDPVSALEVRRGEVVRKGLDFLLSKQDEDGAIGRRGCGFMYDHAIATLALAEAYGMTNSVRYRPPAQKAVGFLVAAQNPGSGWRYTPRCGESDTSVTGWCVMALKSAQIGGLEVPESAFDGAKAWIERVTDSEGKTGYDKLGMDNIVIARTCEWRNHPTMTAVGLLSRIFIDKRRHDPALARSAAVLLRDLPTGQMLEMPSLAEDGHSYVRYAQTLDHCYWYFGTLALFQLDGPDGKTWRAWDRAHTKLACDLQRTRQDGCAAGSWESENDRWGHAGGRVYTTALSVLSLQTYYAYRSVFGDEAKSDAR